MLNKFKKLIPVILLIIITSSLGVFIFGVEAAKADGLGIVDGFKTLLGGFLLMMQELIGGLVAWFAGLAQGILNFTSLQNAQMVKDGWEITRDLTNMFFVLILMIIAFATILKIESHGMKTLLPKLIIAALLINFSLVFCGAIIDSAGVLTNFFIKDSQNFFENIADEMQLTKIMVGTTQEPTESKWACNIIGPDVPWKDKTLCDAACIIGTLGGTCYEIKPPKVEWGDIKGDHFWKVISALLLSIIFTIIAVFVFAALAFLLLIRVLVIWFLLILAPIAWFFWILPATKNLWEKWWHAFIKWVFFAPAAIFFIWLSVNSWLKFIKGKAPMTGGEIIEGMNNVVSNGVLETKLMPQVMAPANFVQFILACGMLIGSLIVAQKISIYGASGTINLMKKTGRAAGRTSLYAGKATMATIGRTPGYDIIPKVEDMKREIMTRAEKAPILGRAIGGIGAYKARQRGKIEEEKKNIANRTSDDLNAISEQRVNSEKDRIRQAAVIEKLAENGKIKGSYGQNKEKLKIFIKSGGDINKVTKTRPDFAPINKKPGDTPEEAINKAVSKINAEDFSKLGKDAMTSDVKKAIQLGFEHNGRLNSKHLSKLGDNPELLNIVRDDIIIPHKSRFRKDVTKYLDGSPGQALYS